MGIDPGYDRLGVAILEYKDGAEHLVFSTCIQTDPTTDLGTRLQSLGEALEALFAQYTPDALGIETIFFNKNLKTAIGVAQARGVALYLAKKAGCALYELGPQQVKIAVTGYGKSDKKAVFEMIKRLIPGVPKDALDDEYDAIAVGITCLAHSRGT
jgi:crossover junction endodeoxyribonuclease RuvC